MDKLNNYNGLTLLTVGTLTGFGLAFLAKRFNIFSNIIKNNKNNSNNILIKSKKVSNQFKSLEVDEWIDIPKITPVQTPHPKWKPGMKQPRPFSNETIALDPLNLSSSYPMIISSVIPRPIAFISSINDNGIKNLAPYSYFNTIAHNPPHVAIGICRRPGGVKKDTLVNIEQKGEFVVNIISEWFIEAANHCCGNFLPDEDEWEYSGLTPVDSLKVEPPRVQESALSMECKLKHMYEIKDDKNNVTTTLIVGEIIMFHAADDVLDKKTRDGGRPRMNLENYVPISRLGGNIYGRVAYPFELPRPDRPSDGRK